MSRSLEEQLKSQVRAVSGRPERVSTEMEAWQGLSAWNTTFQQNS